MKCITYELILTNSIAALSDLELKKIVEALKDIPEADYYIRIHHTPLNRTAEYSIGIIILRKSLKEAEPVSTHIREILTSLDINIQLSETTLLWDEYSEHYQMDISDRKC